MRRLYTSDQHLFNLRIIYYCNRPFETVEEMDEEIISRYNAVVEHDDTVFHFGDVAMGKISESLPKIGRLNGKKILIPGNHDRIFSGQSEKNILRFMPEYLKVFDEIWPEQADLDIDGHSVKLCHFPYSGDSKDTDRFVDKRPVDDGRPLIHGHVHNSWVTNGRQFNVGVDVHHFAPVPESVIIDWLRSL